MEGRTNIYRRGLQMALVNTSIDYAAPSIDERWKILVSKFREADVCDVDHGFQGLHLTIVRVFCSKEGDALT